MKGGGLPLHLNAKVMRAGCRAPAMALIAGLLSLPGPAMSQSVARSGYAISSETCGVGELRFPRLKIDLKKGFCAGLVADETDQLRFPRSIVQIPGHELFVISDMGGWGHSDGKLLLLDPHAAEG